MDYVDDYSDSDQELDNQELEAALYSQIHFDPGTQAEECLGSENYSYLRHSAPLRVEVKELPVRITSSLKQPVFGGEFISFSWSKTEDDEEGGRTEPHDLASSHQDKDKILKLEPAVVESGKKKSKGRNVQKQTVVSSPGSNRLKSASVVKHQTDGSRPGELNKSTDSFEKLQVKSPLLEYKIDGKYKLNSIPNNLTSVNKSNSDGSKHKRLIKQETGKSTSKVKNLIKGGDAGLKEKKLCLPFSVTKASKKQQKVAETECVRVEKTKEAQSVHVGKKKVTSKLAKLESFLELPKSGTVSSVQQQKKKKRASLSKTDAAVKPRTPKFFLRRPPATVVKYRQDSDTNTDYSDSDASTTNSPVKGKQKTLEDKSLHQKSVGEGAKPKPKNKNTTDKVTDAKTQEKSDTAVLSKHQERQCDEVVSNDPERATSGSHDVSMSSEDEDETGEDTRDESDLQKALSVGNDTGDGSSSSGEEESTTGTESSDPEEFMAENIPGLEFNLNREVAGFAGKNPDSWKINDKDRHSVTSTLNRYFFPRSIQCRNCRVEGHLSRDCPKPLKRRCLFCGMEGHSYHSCPDGICFNCSAPGHRVYECREPKVHRATVCNRCWMPGHDEKKCPDRWRQYHITVGPKGSDPATAAKDVRNPLVFCYNCGKKGHLGFECKVPRMNKFTSAPYPFVAHYDSKSKDKEMKRDRQSISESSRASNLTDYKPKKQHSSQKGFDRDKRYRLKDQKVERSVQENEDEYAHRATKRSRSSQKRTDEQRANFKTGSRSRERNHPAGQDYKAVYVRDQRSDVGHFRGQEIGEREAMDDILSDLGRHQVNDNEWWTRSGKSVKKRRKKNPYTISSDVTGDDWQGDRQEYRKQLLDKDIITFQGSQAHRFEAKRHGKEWKKNKHRQRDDGKSRHEDFTPEFRFNQEISHPYENSRVNNYREHEVNDFSIHMQNQEYRSSLRQSKSHHTGLQKKGSGFSPREGGFQVRNDRFVAMKRNHSITVRFRK